MSDWTQERHHQFARLLGRVAGDLEREGRSALDEIERLRGVVAHQDRIIALNAGQTPSTVTDEMVEAAAAAAVNRLPNRFWARLPENDREKIRAEMRVTLEAAMGVKA